MERFPERDPGALSGALAGVSFVASLVALNALSDARYPMPGADPRTIRRFFGQEHGPARLGAGAQVVCAMSLARFAKSAAALAARSERGSRGLRAASIVGGGVAVASLVTSALCTVTLTTSRAKRDADADGCTG